MLKSRWQAGYFSRIPISALKEKDGFRVGQDVNYNLLHFNMFTNPYKEIEIQILTGLNQWNGNPLKPYHGRRTRPKGT